ncbi:MAG: Na+/H+ antiporter NhaA [Acidobacteria bacterium]|nr:MAG: Na+/H+ antiporter NhaA [Acidobacteriota bacterium]REK10370.1 MAG: Na+/H+ antiporter NhaA [Acidobacteriota bacterium]
MTAPPLRHESRPRSSPAGFLRQFFAQESAAGVLLMVAAVLAVMVANSPLSRFYDLLLSTPVSLSVGDFAIDKPLLLWVNDGLMAIFFLLVGLELKRECVEGELSQRSNVILPGVGAIGGMLFPAGFYLAFNHGDPVAAQGWAIPAATDIAFALGVLSLLGSRVPTSLKVFVTTLAIFDDVGAILIIAFFYTANISLTALLTAAGCIVLLVAMNARGVVRQSPYLLVGLVMWTALLKSGVHATLAGVMLGLTVPMRCRRDPTNSPVKTLEHDLHSIVAYFVLPVFAFCNAGLRLTDTGLDDLLHPVPLGIAMGLFFGKQIGVFLCCWIAVAAGWTRLPRGMSYPVLYGAAALTGIGFTMSLFIGSLAFEETGVDLLFDERLGIIVGSLASATVAVAVLSRVLPRENSAPS